MEEPVPGLAGRVWGAPHLSRDTGPSAGGLCTEGQQGRLQGEMGSSTPGQAIQKGTRRPLLACQLAVEARQGNGKSLQSAQRVVVIHGEHVLSYAAKLHHDVVRWSPARAWMERQEVEKDRGDIYQQNKRKNK